MEELGAAQAASARQKVFKRVKQKKNLNGKMERKIPFPNNTTGIKYP